MYSDTIKFTGFQSIWNGTSWKHLQPDNIEKRHGRRNLTDRQVREIRDIVSTNSLSYKSLGEVYGVPASTICNIIKRKTYKNVE